MEGGYGSEGVGRVFAGGVVLGVGKEEVGWQDSWGKKGYQGMSLMPWRNAAEDHPVESASGEGLLIDAPSNGTLVVNGTEAEAVDIFASNGSPSTHVPTKLINCRSDPHPSIPAAS